MEPRLIAPDTGPGADRVLLPLNSQLITVSHTHALSQEKFFCLFAYCPERKNSERSLLKGPAYASDSAVPSKMTLTSPSSALGGFLSIGKHEARLLFIRFGMAFYIGTACIQFPYKHFGCSQAVQHLFSSVSYRHWISLGQRMSSIITPQKLSDILPTPQQLSHCGMQAFPGSNNSDCLWKEQEFFTMSLESPPHGCSLALSGG